MYILFKRYGASHLFKSYFSREELDAEILKGHNDRFFGNNQFWYDTTVESFEILNRRIDLTICKERLEHALHDSIKI